MDLWNQLISNPGKMPIQTVATGQTRSTLRAAPAPAEDSSDDEMGGTEYAAQYEEEEINTYMDARQNPQTGTFSCVDGPDDAASTLRIPMVHQLYQDYPFAKPSRDELPIDRRKKDILSALEITNILIIQGETGCGKTTQVPQFILDSYRERNEYCNIIVTQPRKIAAVSVAEHVSRERAWPLGTVCGYQVGLEKNVQISTILTYVTAGVLLQKLINRKNLLEFTHIIIDEVHERTQEMDFILILLRRFMNTNSIGVKIILMSATFDTDKFADYFRTISLETNIPATRIVVPTGNPYDKSIHFMEEIAQLGNPPPLDKWDIEMPTIFPEVYEIFKHLIRCLPDIDNNAGMGHVLVFLPGIYEIEYVYNMLMEESGQSETPFYIVPLHSSIPAKEQSNAFRIPKPGKRKIILSTNIAESSITVPDIFYIIDFCLTKSMVVDPTTQHQSLQLSWASKTNCTQRAGRVGRVCDGRVYRLVPEIFYHEYLPNDIAPEMLRAPLERVVLLSKHLDLDELPQAILALALDPPNLINIKSTIKYLKEVGALLPTTRGQFIDGDGDLTNLGIIMCKLPLEVKLSKLIALGYMFSRLTDCIIMAAGCSLANVFATPFIQRLDAYGNKLYWADTSCSDLVAYLRLYHTFGKNMQSGVLGSREEERQFCQRNFLSYRSMREWRTLVAELTNRLESMNITDQTGPSHVGMTDIERNLILKVVICGAFYPNYYTRSEDAGQVNEEVVFNELKGLNPYTTVFFRNMDREQPQPLYEESIKKIVRPIGDENDIYFDNTQKVYVSFSDDRKPCTVGINGRPMLTTMPGNISVYVYKAVRMRQLRMATNIAVMHKNAAWQLAESKGIAVNSGGVYSLIKELPKKKSETILPGLHINFMKIVISTPIDAGHFYAHPVTSQCKRTLKAITEALNHEKSLEMARRESICVDALFACRYSDGNFYRCRVIRMEPFRDNDIRIEIIFIDFGSKQNVTSSDLFDLPLLIRNLPAQAMECVLSGVQPVVVRNPLGKWSQEANEAVNEWIADAVELKVQIYSVVNNIVSVELMACPVDVSINQRLVNDGHAEDRQESYLSREDHEQRVKLRQCKVEGVLPDELNTFAPITPAIHVKAPSTADCRSDITLHGPFSPLEMKVYPMSRSDEEVRIDQSSVNTVLLDYEPQDPHERLLVAGQVSKVAHKPILNLRHTTMMPNIHGLSSLMALIFCPLMKPKASKYGASYASFLCGLGKDHRNKPIYPEHDLVVVVDVDISTRDLTLVNEIRYIMNAIMKRLDMSLRGADDGLYQYHRNLKDRITTLLFQKRDSQPREHVQYANSWTQCAYVTNILAPPRNETDFIWPLHCALQLQDKDSFQIKLKHHLDILNSYIRDGLKMPEAVFCEFCDVSIVTLSLLRLHILSPEHKAKVAEMLPV